MKFGDRKGIDTLQEDGFVVALDLSHVMSYLVSQEGISTECVEIHISTDADKLRPGKIIEGEIVFEKFADLDNIGLSRMFARCSDLKMQSISCQEGSEHEVLIPFGKTP